MPPPQPPSAAPPNSAEPPPPFSQPTTLNRLSLRDTKRVGTAATIGLVIGGILGGTHAGQMASLRFRAENAHRLPTTTKGWYLYHKSKNYHVALDALKGGAKLGAQLSLWAGGFFAIEAVVDASRGDRRDFLSTTCAGLSVAGAFSVWSMLSGLR